MFKGAYTALVTPFNQDESIDYGRLAALVETQVQAGIAGLVPVGSTGESSTLTMAEHIRVIEETVKAARGRVPVIAGTGANSTAEAIELTRHARDVGAHATLQVTPYYNKPNQEGLIRHFSAVAELGLPVILYNIPGRTGREIALDTVAKLGEHPRIVAIKEAGQSVDRVSAIVRRSRMTVLSGDDSLTLPMMAVGATGVISVVTNLIPAPVVEMCRLALAGDFLKAREIHLKHYRLFCDLFVDTNPIPIKAAMAMRGMLQEVYRLPLCPLSPAHRETVRLAMQELGLP